MADDPAPSPWFWEILESSHRSLRSLCGRLEQLSRHELQRYHLEYEAAKDQVNPCYWDECAEHLLTECSEDHGDDFAAWVVMQGREFYEQVSAHPEEVHQHLDLFSEVDRDQNQHALGWDEEVGREEYRGYQRADYVVAAVYRLRFGRDLDAACVDG
jgi:hypothetical protein